MSTFHSFARYGSSDAAKTLLQTVNNVYDCNLNDLLQQKDNNGNNVFHFAAENDSAEVMPTILNAVDDERAQFDFLKVTNSEGLTPILSAECADVTNAMLRVVSESAQLNIVASSPHLDEISDDVRSKIYSRYGEEEQEALVSRSPRNPRLTQLMKWAESQPGYYYLTVPPQVLIFFTEVDREIGANEESAAFQKAFDNLGCNVTVKKDFTECDMTVEIRKAQNSKPLSSLIVGVFTHGHRGVVYDKDNRRIEINDLILTMAPEKLEGIPKVLIIQSCQGFPEGVSAMSTVSGREDAFPKSSSRSSQAEATSQHPSASTSKGISSTCGTVASTSTHRQHQTLTDEDFPPVELRVRDFTLIMSTVSRVTCHRNAFIPRLAKHLLQSSVDDDISAAYEKAHAGVRKRFPDQIPIIIRTTRRKLNVQRYFRYV